MSEFGEVEVLDVFGNVSVRFLRCGSSILGALWLDPEFVGQSVFNAFSMMQGAVEFMVRPMRPDRVLVLGLGAGDVPSALRRAGKVVDVVEVNEAVISAASNYFGYDRAGGGHGQTFMGDAAIRLQSLPTRYDVVIHDLYDGLNHATSTDVLRLIKGKNMREDGRGVLLLNMVGTWKVDMSRNNASLPHFLTFILAQNLAKVFTVVRVFSEEPVLEDSGMTPGNLLFAASDHPIDWSVPPTMVGDEASAPIESHDGVMWNFMRWSIPELSNATELLLPNFDEKELDAMARSVQMEMWTEVRHLLPREAWGGDYDRFSHRYDL